MSNALLGNYKLEAVLQPGKGDRELFLLLNSSGGEALRYKCDESHTSTLSGREREKGRSD